MPKYITLLLLSIAWHVCKNNTKIWSIGVIYNSDAVFYIIFYKIYF